MSVTRQALAVFEWRILALIRQICVVLLQRAGGVRVGVGERDGRVAFARLREGGVVDAGDAQAERCASKQARVSARCREGARAFERDGERSPMGKVDWTEFMVILCSTTDLRSPWCSAAPERSVNFFCAPTAHRGAVGTQCAGSKSA